MHVLLLALLVCIMGVGDDDDDEEDDDDDAADTSDMDEDCDVSDVTYLVGAEPRCVT